MLDSELALGLDSGLAVELLHASGGVLVSALVAGLGAEMEN